MRTEFILALASVLFGVQHAANANTIRLSGPAVRLIISGIGPGTRELVQFRTGNIWRSSLDTSDSVVRVKRINESETKCYIQSVFRLGTAIVEKGTCGQDTFERTLQLGPDPDLVSVAVRYHPHTESQLLSVEDRFIFSPEPHHLNTPRSGPLDFVWSQNIKAARNDVIANWGFKAPAVMFQQADVFAAIIPQVNLLSADQLRRTPTALDLDVTSGDRAWFSYGAVSSRPAGHSYFVRAEDLPLAPLNGVIHYSYWLSTSAQPSREGYRAITHLLWTKFGRANLKDTVDLQQNVFRKQLYLFNQWRQEAWIRYAGEKFWDYDCGTNIRCGSISSNRNPWGHWEQEPKRDAWFNSWFQTLRSAYGWYVYARRESNAALEQKAEEVLNLILRSPQHSGMFSTIYIADTNTWLPDDGWAGFSSDYHTFCMSWTGYWMLRWAEDLVPERKGEVLAFLQPYADLLLKVQRPNGLIPSWFHPDLKVRNEFGDFNAESAGSALFLAEFSHFTNQDRYLQAAIRAQEYMAENVLPRQRWYDFETFISCARKPFSFYDPWTAQYPQNNLSTIQAAMAYLRLFTLTRNPKYLHSGQRVLDYLLLTQQVWNHPLLTPKLIGGTTTQNTDAEWSDARECYFATLLLDYYQQTNDFDYLERAVAAARSGLAVAPWENWAHNGHQDEHGALTGFHWGTGSEMASVEMMTNFLGDAFIDVDLQRGVGFDACAIQRVAVKGHQISLTLNAALTPRDLLIRFSGLHPANQYVLSLNDRQVTIADGATLLKKGYLAHLE